MLEPFWPPVREHVPRTSTKCIERLGYRTLHQETFRVTLEKIRSGDLRDASGLSGFIASLARNLATDYFRRKASLATEDPAALDSVQAPQPSALERLIEVEQAQIHSATSR